MQTAQTSHNSCEEGFVTFLGQAMCWKKWLNSAFEVEAREEHEGALRLEELGADEVGAFAFSLRRQNVPTCDLFYELVKCLTK